MKDFPQMCEQHELALMTLQLKDTHRDIDLSTPAR